MSTKLDKNFGLGNSYKNVKLVKSAVRKVDASVEEEVSDKVTTEQLAQAIEELKAGTLPVYFQSEIGEEDLSTLSYPCLIYDGNGNLYFVDYNGDDRVYGFNIQVTAGMTEIYSMSSMTIEEETSFNDWLEDANFEKFATENVVDQNKGTKLYHKRILASGNIQVRLYLLNETGFTPNNYPIITSAYGYASNSNHYIPVYTTPTTGSCEISLYCIETASNVVINVTNSDLID